MSVSGPTPVVPVPIIDVMATRGEQGLQLTFILPNRYGSVWGGERRPRASVRHDGCCRYVGFCSRVLDCTTGVILRPWSHDDKKVFL